MAEEHSSFLKTMRAKFGHHRSISQPPPDRSIEWTSVPVEYRPVGKLETRIVNPDGHTLRPDIPARYHPNPLQQEIKRSARASAPLLQLPRPRAMWRRSLEDLSPTKKTDWWSDPDLEAQRMTFNIACALPPQYLEPLPGYSDEDGKSASPFHNIFTGERIPFFDDGKHPIPTSRTATSPENRSPRRGSSPVQGDSGLPNSRDDLTIDSLLSHPMLRVERPPDDQDPSR